MNHSCMLHRLFVVCAFSLLSAVSLHAFEGKVEMTMTSGKNVYPVTYYIKGLHMRTEMTISNDKKGRKMEGICIFDMEAHEMDVLMVEQKMYMSMHIDTDSMTNGKSAQSLDFKPTGRTENIAGYDAEEYAGVSEGKRTEMWVTKELGQFVMANQGKPGRKPSQSSQWEKFMREGNFFALRVIQRTKEGSPEQFRMEVTHVEKGAQPESLFHPPEDFKKFEMPNVGDMFKNMIPGH